MSFEEERRAIIKRGEGSVAYMYLDTRGYVTVGVGHMMPTADAAQELPFIHRDGGAAASLDDIAQEFDTIKARPYGQNVGHWTFEPYTTLILSETEIDALLDRRIAEFETGLRNDFPNYDTCPETARLGLMDMAFNLGNHGLVTKFPSFTRAARSGDWRTCAAECRRTGIGQSRNDEVRALFEEAYDEEI